MMTPQEGSKLCIKMAGYGIRHDVVKAIQEDAKLSALQKLADYFSEDAFYSENRESGKIGILIEKYIEDNKNNL
jgi:hypothetical protein